jgi:hypothetical protein
MDKSAQDSLTPLENSNKNAILSNSSDDFSSRRKIYKTAREEFFKDLMKDDYDDVHSINKTTYDDFKRSISKNNLDPSKYVPKVRVSGKTVPTSVQDSGTVKSFVGSLASLSQSRTSNRQQETRSTFRNVVNNVFHPDSPLIKHKVQGTHGLLPHQYSTSYGSLKKRKQLKTANLPNLLR